MINRKIEVGKKLLTLLKKKEKILLEIFDLQNSSFERRKINHEISKCRDAQIKLRKEIVLLNHKNTCEKFCYATKKSGFFDGDLNPEIRVHSAGDNIGLKLF